MGLKRLGLLHAVPLRGQLKSDQCGIETVILKNAASLACSVLKSDQCGIETCVPVACGGVGHGLKSDQCGIETVSVSPAHSTRTVLKSDQCGIETYLCERIPHHTHIAQIGPMWD